jgi:hypothetical protein
MRAVLHTGAQNIALLVLAALPLGVAVLGVQTALWPPSWSGAGATLPDAASAALFQFLTLCIPVAAAGLVHQAVLWLLPNQWPRPRLRAAILGTALIIPLLLAAMSTSPVALLSTRAVLPLGALVVCYGLGAKPIPKHST